MICLACSRCACRFCCCCGIGCCCICGGGCCCVRGGWPGFILLMYTEVVAEGRGAAPKVTVAGRVARAGGGWWAGTMVCVTAGEALTDMVGTRVGTVTDPCVEMGRAVRGGTRVTSSTLTSLSRPTLISGLPTLLLTTVMVTPGLHQLLPTVVM